MVYFRQLTILCSRIRTIISILQGISLNLNQVYPRFLNWNCPRGISGKKHIGGRCCPLKHLRVCNQFRLSGSTGMKGCKKGKNCTFFHLKICRAVSDSESCSKKDRDNFHPRSSRKKENNNPTNISQITSTRTRNRMGMQII